MVFRVEKSLLLPLVQGLVILLLAADVRAENRLLTLGTGGVTGLYYPAGGAICRLINQSRQQHGIRCSLRSSLGSVDNLQQVAGGTLDVGISEAGQLDKAVKRQNDLSSPGNQLRTLVGLFPEYISLLVAKDSGIRQFSDLKGRRFNQGKAGSSQRATVEILMAGRGWQYEDFSHLEELPPAEQASALCENRIDATLYVVGQPSGVIKEAIRDCGSRLIGLAPEDIAALEAYSPHYQALTLPGSLYSDDQPDVRTAGVNATLFTRADLPEEAAYAVVRALFDQFEQFQQLHPAFATLDRRGLVHVPLAARLHPGGGGFFREKGWLN